MASAVSRMSDSSIRQPNLFQLFQPIGGVGARPVATGRGADEGFAAVLRQAAATTQAVTINVLVEAMRMRMKVPAVADGLYHP